MRVVQMMAGAEYGGAEMQFVEVACALHAAGVEQLVLTRDIERRVARLAACGVPYRTQSFAKFPPFLTRIALNRLVRAFRPDIVQAWMGRAAEFARYPELPVIGWFGGYHDLKRFRHCDYFVSISEDIVRHIVAGGAERAHVLLIHQFSDIADAPPVGRNDLGASPDRPLLLTLARLHPRKGLDVLIEAMTRLPGVDLWIAGEGPLRGELETMIGKRSLGDRIKLLGWREDRAALLRAADLFVLPSRFEPFGIVILEAWALGTPVVAAASQGPRSYIRHGETGLLCAVDDVEGLATAIGACLSDVNLRRRLAEAGRQEYLAKFTRDVAVRGFLDLYAEILRERRAPGNASLAGRADRIGSR